MNEFGQKGKRSKPIKEGQNTVTVSLRMTEEQRDALVILGGAEWVRYQIDNAVDQADEVCHAGPL